MTETTFFKDEKKLTCTLVALCLVTLVFFLFFPIGSYVASKGAQGQPFTLTGFSAMKPFAASLLVLMPILAAVWTYLKPDKTNRLIAGGILLLGFIIFLIAKAPAKEASEGMEAFEEFAAYAGYGDSAKPTVGLGTGMFLYLFSTIGYCVVVFLSYFSINLLPKK